MEQQTTIALFGEAEKGPFDAGIVLRNLEQLFHECGHPPEDSLGLHYAVQSLTYHEALLFFRVREEGFSFSDYEEGMDILRCQEDFPFISAIVAPGVGDRELFDPLFSLCEQYGSLLITNEKDLYDYLTSFSLIR